MHRLSLLAVLAAATLLPAACRPKRPAPPVTPTSTDASPAQDDAPDEPVAKRPRGKKSDAAPAHEAEPADAESGRLAGITAAHNRVRARLDIEPLEWSPELARFAQKWADKLARKGCRLQHRPRSGPDAQKYGENIFAISGAPATADDVVDAWAAEVKDYNPKTNRCKGVCGHYTQVVWRKSQQLGCGMAACGDTEVWVCNYDPRGNYNGERPY